MTRTRLRLRTSRTLVLVVGMVTAWLGTSSAAGAYVTTASTVAAYHYDIHHEPAIPNDNTGEPPAEYDRVTTYDSAAPVVQPDNTTTRQNAGAAGGRLSSLRRSHIVANFGPRSLGAAERLRYEAALYHGLINRGAKNAAPTNGQAALGFSVSLRGTTTRRLGVDPDSGEIVIFDETAEGVFHGHVRSWSELTNRMKSVLIKEGLVDRRGNIL